MWVLILDPTFNLKSEVQPFNLYYPSNNRPNCLCKEWQNKTMNRVEWFFFQTHAVDIVLALCSDSLLCFVLIVLHFKCQKAFFYRKNEGNFKTNAFSNLQISWQPLHYLSLCLLPTMHYYKPLCRDTLQRVTFIDEQSWNFAIRFLIRPVNPE